MINNSPMRIVTVGIATAGCIEYIVQLRWFLTTKINFFEIIEKLEKKIENL